MFETVFEILFKFNRLQFEEGNLLVQADPPVLFWSVFLFLLLAFIAIYVVANIYTASHVRAVSIGLRLVALLLLCLPFLEPVLSLPDVVPDENFLAVLVDYSGSMDIEDGALGTTRYDDIRQILVEHENAIAAELGANFKLRYYNFSHEASRVDSLSTLTPNGKVTSLSAALTRVASDFKGLPLAGVLVFSDGADNGAGDPREAAEELRGMGVPLHIVGLGGEKLANERELLEVKTNKGLREGSGAEVEVKIRSWIEESEPAILNIFDGENLVYAKQVNLKGDGKIDYLSFSMDVENREAREYTVTIAPLPNEANNENNSLNVLINAKRDTTRVLYFEGHLRQEFKFIKRALENDQVVDVASISRTGPSKYFRQGIRNRTELSGGFPTSEEELFKFKAVIFGDIEASFFSLEQLSMIERFVRKRGGGFLMLGGRNSYVEGGFWNTPIADILPMELDPGRRSVLQPQFRGGGIPEEEEGYAFTPTRQGLENPILKLTSELRRNKAMWAAMPRLFSINYLGRAKPGATVLAEKPKDRFGESEPLLVTQRYGRGRAAALATASTWRWQMLREAEDTNHERFWRQFIRWLSTPAPDQVNVVLPEDRFKPREEIPIRTVVYDDSFEHLESVEVSGTITDPYGGIHELRFLPEITEPGEFTANYVPNDPGVYAIEVEALQNGVTIDRESRSFISRHGKDEFYNATLKTNLLENLAGLTKGVYYEPSQFRNIPTNLTSRKTATSVWRSESIWDMPLIFLLVVILLSIEWVYRRYRGLP